MKQYKMLTPGNKVCISLKTLFETLHNGDIHTTDIGHKIRRSKEDDGSEYACCDGEEVEVKSVEGPTVTFLNKNQEKPQEFKLTIRECETAIFGLK